MTASTTHARAVASGHAASQPPPQQQQQNPNLQYAQQAPPYHGGQAPYPGAGGAPPGGAYYAQPQYAQPQYAQPQYAQPSTADPAFQVGTAPHTLHRMRMCTVFDPLSAAPPQAQFESNLQQLASMGFDRKAAGDALLRTNNNLQAAVDMLVAGR